MLPRMLPSVPMAAVLWLMPLPVMAEQFCLEPTENWETDLGAALVGDWRTEMIAVHRYFDDELREQRPDPLSRVVEIVEEDTGLVWNDGTSESGYRMIPSDPGTVDFSLPGEAPLSPSTLLADDVMGAEFDCSERSVLKYVAHGELDLGVLLVAFDAHFLVLSEDRIHVVIMMDMNGDDVEAEPELVRAVLSYSR